PHAPILLPRFAYWSHRSRRQRSCAASVWIFSGIATARAGCLSSWRLTMKRVMCVYLPKWPLQRLRNQRPELRDKSVALCDPHYARCAHVILCSRQAKAAGIRPGMPVAEALALDRNLSVKEVDRKSDVQALQRLAQWLERYSPIVGLEEEPAPESL